MGNYPSVRHKRNIVEYTCQYEECGKKFKDFDTLPRKFCSVHCEKLARWTRFNYHKNYEI